MPIWILPSLFTGGAGLLIGAGASGVTDDIKDSVKYIAGAYVIVGVLQYLRKK